MINNKVSFRYYILLSLLPRPQQRRLILAAATVTHFLRSASVHCRPHRIWLRLREPRLCQWMAKYSGPLKGLQFAKHGLEVLRQSQAEETRNKFHATWNAPFSRSLYHSEWVAGMLLAINFLASTFHSRDCGGCGGRYRRSRTVFARKLSQVPIPNMLAGRAFGDG